MILGIYCSGSFGREVYDVAVRVNDTKHRWEEILFVDDVREESRFYNARVCRLDEFAGCKESIEFIIANGTPKHRKDIFERLVGQGYQLTNLIDPTAIVSPMACLGKGVIVLQYSCINSNAKLMDNSLVHLYVAVGHDIVVNEHSIIGTTARIGGKTTIGAETFLGEGAIIRDHLKIGRNTIVSMGAVVYRDVPDNVIVMGHPARVIQKNIDGNVY